MDTRSFLEPDDHVRFTRSGVLAGFVQGQALAMGVLVYGVVFGVLASGARMLLGDALLMSAAIYSGSAQIATLQSWAQSPLLAPALATILMMNARYVLYGAALRPWMGRLPPWLSYPTLFFLGDANWALSMTRHGTGERDAGFVLGSGVAMYAPWLAGTWIGYLLGSAVPDPTRFGFDFMLVAFSTALATELWRGRSDLRVAGAALATALMCNAVRPSGWTIVAAGLAGGTVAYVTHRERAA
jgi:predicted branched-subunit amino acid permease